MERMIRMLTAVAFAFTVFGCQSAAESDSTGAIQNTSQMITLGDRHYVLALPANYQNDESYKLLLAFHPSGGSSEGMQQLSQFERMSSDYIVAYPKSAQVEWNEGCQCNIAHRLGADDLGFTQAVINDVRQRYRITAGEVYAAGYSQGGLFVQNLACHLSEQFKAVAVVGAPMSKQLASSCAPQQALSVMMVHGQADKVLPYRGRAHGNFALISSPDALALHAEKHAALPYALEKDHSANVVLRNYHNGTQKFQLYSVKSGGHSWQFEGFNTSREILQFFSSAHEPELPEHSRLVTTAEGQFHVRAMGLENTGPAVVLLAGPNANYHSDSAWFAALQPLLAKQYRVYSVDRLGTAFSSQSDNVSYRRFADDLAAVMQQLGETELAVVAFASASITARWFYESHQQQFDIQAMLYIDPDIPLAHSLSLYQGYPADWYQANLDKLLPHLAAGNWTERTRGKLEAEYQQVRELVDESAALMDWSYFEQIMQTRLLVPQQQARAREIAAYSADLNGYATLPMLTEIPVSVIDSDFEQQDIVAAADDAELVAALQQWQREGSAWSAEQASASGGQYIALRDSDHLVPLQHPQAIQQALQWLLRSP